MDTVWTKASSKARPLARVARLKNRPSGVTKAGGGVVRCLVHGPSGWTVASRIPPGKLVEILESGLPVQELEVLRASLDVPLERLASLLGISKATLHRRKVGGRIGPDESDRVVRFARLMGRAIEVMESDTAARHWLASPQVGLGGAVPLDYARTEIGAREVEDLLGRIEFGVYS